MDQKRLMELAVKQLEKQKAAVYAEIGAIRAELRGTRAMRTAIPASTTIIARRRRTPAERNAHSDLMQKIWAARKTREAKNAIPQKSNDERAAINKAISAAMKAARARRKVKAAGKTARPASTKISPKP
jgi:TPP-dependent indolepyruvate ferredoxin oxidoreductase alpha subunit